MISKIRDLKIWRKLSNEGCSGEIIDAPVADAKRIALQHIQTEPISSTSAYTPRTAKREVSRTFAEVSAVTDEYNVPLSIDSVDPELICAGIGVRRWNSFSHLPAENAAEIGPTLARKDSQPWSYPKTAMFALTGRSRAHFWNQQIIADPVLYPIGSGASNSLAESTASDRSATSHCFLRRRQHRLSLWKPTSIGANALLAGLAMELGLACFLLLNTVTKAMGSVKELKIAASDDAARTVRKSPPKDLGIDLLVLKERRRRPEYRITSTSVLDAKDFDTAKWALTQPATS